MIDDKIQKANEGLTKLADVVQSKGAVKWLILAAAILLVLVVGMVLAKAHAGGYPNFGGGAEATAIAGAVAGAHATSAAVGLGGTGAGGSATVNDSSKSWALGLPALAGSGNGCTESFSLVVAASWMTPVCRLQHELAVVESLPLPREAKDIAKMNVTCKYEFMASAIAACAGRK